MTSHHSNLTRRSQSLGPIGCLCAFASISFSIWTANTTATSARRVKTRLECAECCAAAVARRQGQTTTDIPREIITLCRAERTLLIWTVQIKPIDIEFYWEMWYADEVIVERRRQLCAGTPCTEWCYRLNSTQIALNKIELNPFGIFWWSRVIFPSILLISLFCSIDRRPTPPLDMHIGINLVAVFFSRSDRREDPSFYSALLIACVWIRNDELFGIANGVCERETERCQLKYGFRAYWSSHVGRCVDVHISFSLFIQRLVSSTVGCLQRPQRQCGVGGQHNFYLNISRVRCALCVLLCTQQPNVNKIDIRFRDNPGLRVANEVRIKGSDRKQYRITRIGNKCQSIYLAFSLRLSHFPTSYHVLGEQTDD